MSGHSFAQRHWYRLSPFSLLLLPVSLLFGIAVAVRRSLYRSGLLAARRLPVPVWVIGNLTVGGTGKTPLVLWTAALLRAAGRHPGIVMRGYAGSNPAPRAIQPQDDPRASGDEPVLLAQRSACPVWTGRDRVAAALALLAANPDCDLILCDDGLQHYRLARDLEIAVEDGRGKGNGLMLPAGPLREPAGRAVDATVINGAEQPPPSKAGRVYRMQLQPAGLARLEGTPVELSMLAGKRLHAVAGIGNPQRFFDTLASLGLQFSAHAFPDHHAYSPADLQFEGCDAVLMTEKDAVKCRSFGRDDLIMLKVTAAPDPALAEFLLKALHGRQTA